MEPWNDVQDGGGGGGGGGGGDKHKEWAIQTALVCYSLWTTLLFWENWSEEKKEDDDENK